MERDVRLLRWTCALAVLSVAWLVAQWPHPLIHPAVGWLPTPLSAGLTIVIARRTARAAPDARTGRFWRHLAVILVLLLSAVLSSAYDSLLGPGAPTQRSSQLTMMLYLGAVIVLVWALLRLPVRRRTSHHVVTFVLDIAIVLAATGLVAWFVADRTSVRLVAAIGSSWSVFGILLMLLAGLVAVVKVALAGAGSLDRGTLWTLGGTLLAGTVTGAVAPLLATRPYLNDCHLSIPACCAGLAIAAIRQQRAYRHGGAARAQRPGRPFSLVPYVTIVAANAFVLLGVGPDQRQTRILVAGSVLLTLLVVARQLISLYENSHLLARVDASMLELRRHERRFRSLVQNSSDIFAISDARSAITYASPSLLRFAGVASAAGLSVWEMVHPDDAERIRSASAGLAAPGATTTFQLRLRHLDGSWRWFEIVTTNLLHDPSVRGVVANARDITESRRYHDQLAYQASHDGLTGLANRALFAAGTAEAVTRRRPGDEGLALALIDLDDFKAINDRLGHAVGDALLVEVSERLRTSVRPGDEVARLGGDEFAVLLPNASREETTRIAEAFIDALAAPVRAAGYELLVQASIGVARHTPDCDASDLLRRADMAMYAAKELGKSRWVEYGPELDAHAVEHAQLAAELSQALDRDELRVVYQPIVGLPDGDIRGVEALVRWHHPDRGVVSPAVFIPVAERTGLIVPIGAWILRESCRQAAHWTADLGVNAPWKMSVNASARQLLEPAFVDTVRDILDESGIPADRLTIEITETAVFGGGRALDTVRGLHALGVKIALDDFGTGHSSLGLLRTCPVDVLKVDKSFVDGVTGTVEQEAIATSISEIAQALRLEAVAEGVETRAQADRLLELGYHLAQGFHFARPLPPSEVEALARTHAEAGVTAGGLA